MHKDWVIVIFIFWRTTLAFCIGRYIGQSRFSGYYRIHVRSKLMDWLSIGASSITMWRQLIIDLDTTHLDTMRNPFNIALSPQLVIERNSMTLNAFALGSTKIKSAILAAH